MKRVLIISILSVVIFVLANVLSFFLFSTEPLTEYQVARVGFPFLFSIESVPDASVWFSHLALWADIMIIVGVTALLVIFYRSIRYDVLRTLGFDV